MNKSTEGAWVIHHAQKLQDVRSGFASFSAIDFAGKCGQLLSSISENQLRRCDNESVNSYAIAAGINVRTELEAILQKLEAEQLIDRGSKSIEVLGVTSGAVLQHTARIFSNETPHPREHAAILMAEETSHAPMLKNGVIQLFENRMNMNEKDADDATATIAGMGLVDHEECHTGEALFFNGNLFKNSDANKILSILSTLSQEETERFHNLDAALLKSGCLRIEKAQEMVGSSLFTRLHSIGLYDVNEIGNERGTHKYVTKPSAFSKFSNSIVDDAFDLAKAFVSSLTYGIETSPYGRGRIQAVGALLGKLIGGGTVGPSTAIGKDYKILELKGVLEIKPSSSYPERYSMRLKKKEVGQLALQVIQDGEAGTSSLLTMPQSSAVTYVGPEETRVYTRKKSSPRLSSQVSEMLSQLRKGGH